jgi:hypothetical protein
MARAPITFSVPLAPPQTVPPFPAWARLHSIPKTREDAGFLAGAAFAARRPLAAHEPPDRRPVALTPGTRQRRRAHAHPGRTEDGAATGHRRRDAW